MKMMMLCICVLKILTSYGKMEKMGKTLFGWVSNHFLKANVEKYYLVLSSDESFSINIDNVSLRTVTTKNCQKLI